MQAAITHHYGPSDILETRELPRPVPAPDQVLVEVHAAAVSAGDLRLRAADFPGISAIAGRLMLGVFKPRAAVQGTMFAGRVVALGRDVRRYALGDQVFGGVDHGAYAEYLAVDEGAAMARMPAGLSYDEAAALPYGAGTALHFLRDLGSLQRGERVLILGASGGVGRFALQLAKHMGAEVSAVCSTGALDRVRELGADHVIDYTREDFSRQGRRYDLIFDIADATSFQRARPSLSPRGRYLTLYVSLRVLAQMAWTRLVGGQQASVGVALGKRERVEELRALSEAGVISPVIGARFPLEQIAQAHAAAERGPQRGTVIVEVVPGLRG